MLRVPGGRRRSLLEAKARGADVRIVYSPLDALALARARAGARGRLLRRRLRDDRARDRADAPARPRPRRPELQRLLEPRPDRPGAAGDPRLPGDGDRRLRRARPRLDGDRDAAVRVRVQRVRPAGRRRRLRADRHPAGGRHAPAPAARGAGRGRERVRARRPARGQPGGAGRAGGGLRRCATTFEWRGLGTIPRSGLRLADAFADWDAEQRFEVPGARIADPKACRCGDVLRGLAKPYECSVFGTACTPERPLGTCMVSSEGACAAYYAYGRHRRRDEVPA